MAEFRLQNVPKEIAEDLDLAVRLYGQPDPRAFILDRLRFVVAWAKQEHPDVFKKQSPVMVFILKTLHAGNATVDEIHRLSANRFDKTEIRLAIETLKREELIEGRKEVWATAGRRGRPEIRYHLKIRE